MLVSIDGDGTTTALIVITAFLPVYRRVGMNPLILATLLGLSNSLMNYVPWGGPSARAATAVHVDLADVVGRCCRPWGGPARRPGPGLDVRKIGTQAPGVGSAAGHPSGKGLITALPPIVDAERAAIRRPKLFWFNLVLTVGLILGMVLGLAPLPVLMMGAFAVAVTVNYPRVSDQKARLAAHADNVVNVVVLLFAAGAFTGILNGTGMSNAMANAALAVIPPQIGPFLAPITALVSMPLTFVMSNDAYYFGVVPVIANAAAGFGIEPAAIARASLIGQPVHSMSPLLAPIYLACGLLGVDVADAQRFALKWAVSDLPAGAGRGHADGRDPDGRRRVTDRRRVSNHASKAVVRAGLARNSKASLRDRHGLPRPRTDRSGSPGRAITLGAPGAFRLSPGPGVGAGLEQGPERLGGGGLAGAGAIEADVDRDVPPPVAGPHQDARFEVARDQAHRHPGHAAPGPRHLRQHRRHMGGEGRASATPTGLPARGWRPGCGPSRRPR
jgi:CitMHS family citrate-Mg2+:H+ or citrate-Ca2+:H+ symporter